jgi:hypothetical protein
VPEPVLDPDPDPDPVGSLTLPPSTTVERMSVAERIIIPCEQPLRRRAQSGTVATGEVKTVCRMPDPIGRIGPSSGCLAKLLFSKRLAFDHDAGHTVFASNFGDKHVLF